MVKQGTVLTVASVGCAAILAFAAGHHSAGHSANPALMPPRDVVTSMRAGYKCWLEVTYDLTATGDITAPEAEWLCK